MSFFQHIAENAGEAGLPFLVIGGYAVMAHGFVRATDDLDLLVRSDQRDRWSRLLEGLGLKVYREAPAFMQFDPPVDAGLPVDLMFVADAVFERMQRGAVPTTVAGFCFGVVSLLHLVALKCHAIQHGRSLRPTKNTEALVQLITLNRLDLNETELRATILDHGNQELYDKLQHVCPSG